MGGGEDALGSDLANLSTYAFGVTRQETRGLGRGRPLRESVRKLRYLKHELLSDLTFANWRRFEFWVQLFVFLIALYLRIYLHYLGQWLYLQWLRVPVYEFAPTGYSVVLKYVSTVLPMEYELGVVIWGPLALACLFFAVVCLAWVVVSVLGHVPEIISRFIAFFGFVTVLDPLFIFIVDAATGNFNCLDPVSQPVCAQDQASPNCECYEGDAFKLYYRFERDEGSGVVGIILTVFVYAVIALVAAFCLYAFLLNVHMDGRMLDLYRRIHAPEHIFLVPNDLELSAAELQWIVSKAQRWRGPRGTHRKVAVCEYVLTDPLDEFFREVTTHLIIYHSSLDGTRELYRHFLRLPDGAVLEIFGDLEGTFGLRSKALQDLLLQKPNEDRDAVRSFFAGLK